MRQKKRRRGTGGGGGRAWQLIQGLLFWGGWLCFCCCCYYYYYCLALWHFVRNNTLIADLCKIRRVCVEIAGLLSVQQDAAGMLCDANGSIVLQNLPLPDNCISDLGTGERKKNTIPTGFSSSTSKTKTNQQHCDVTKGRQYHCVVRDNTSGQGCYVFCHLLNMWKVQKRIPFWREANSWK